jgi:probable HAF family extracellular repeat protein
LAAALAVTSSLFALFACRSDGSGGTDPAADPPEIVVAATDVAMFAGAGGAAPAERTVPVTSANGAGLTGLSLSVAHQEGPAAWLSATLDRPTAPATITLAATTNGLAAGVYTAVVQLTSSTTDVQPVDLDVRLTLTGFVVRQTDGATLVSESGGKDELLVSLAAPTTSSVVLEVSNDRPEEAIVSPGTLTFTANDWSDAQTVVVTGVDDAEPDGDRTSTLTISVDAEASDDAFDVLPSHTIVVTTADDDTPTDHDTALLVTQTGGSTAVSESGTTDELRVALNRRPATNVVLTVTSDRSAEATVTPARLTFTPGNWSTAQTVTVTGVQDGSRDGDQVSRVTIAVDAAASDAAFAAADPVTVSVTTLEDDDSTDNDDGAGAEEVELQPLPGATDVRPTAIDRHGRVVGTSGGRAVIWEEGVPTALPGLPGDFEEGATSINDAGQIVGVAYAAEDDHLKPYRALLWQDGQVIDLGTLPGHTGARANHIDNAGRIVGHSEISVDPPPNAPRRRTLTAVVWFDGEIRALPTPEGFPTAPNADFSNSAGLVLGTSVEDDGEPYGRHIVWDANGEILWSGGGPGDGAGILNHWVGITEAGDAYVTDTEHQELEFHWRDGGPTGWASEPPKKFIASVSPGGLLVGGVWVDYPDELEWGYWKNGEFFAIEDEEGCSLIGDGGHVVCGASVRKIDLGASSP